MTQWMDVLEPRRATNFEFSGKVRWAVIRGAIVEKYYIWNDVDWDVVAFVL